MNLKLKISLALSEFIKSEGISAEDIIKKGFNRNTTYTILSRKFINKNYTIKKLEELENAINADIQIIISRKV